MVRREFELQTGDHVQLFGRVWTPESEPRAVVCLLHGLGEHSGRYPHVAEKLTGAGFAVVAADLRGHGKSGGQRGHSPSLSALFSDIDLLVGEARSQFPNLPWFLYGHSLGAILVLAYAVHKKPNPAGIITTSPALRSSLAEQKLKVLLAKVLGSLVPTFPMPSGLDIVDLSHDKRVIDAYKADPLVHDRVTTRMGKVMLEAINGAFSKARYFPVPLLMMHGSLDPVAYCKGSVEFAELVPQNCTIKIWDGMLHEIHNEPDKGEVFDYLINWLENRLPENASGQRLPGMGKFEPA